MAQAVLSLRLFGAIEITIAGERVSPIKEQAMLAFLATERGPHSRSELITLFWADKLQRKAEQSLRAALCHIRFLLGPEIAGKALQVPTARTAPTDCRSPPIS